MPALDYDSARRLLNHSFADAETRLLQKSPPSIHEEISRACKSLFRSKTQAYREVILGCVVARIQDKNINIRQPYVNQGPNAFNGRTLDEQVINPFLHDYNIPSSRGPYLNVFRRGVQFDTTTRSGLRDKHSYDAFLTIITYLESVTQDAELHEFLQYLLYEFAELREEAHIPLTRLQRISLEQYDLLVSGLLSTPSGGRLPLLLVVAMFTAIKECFRLNWNITYQGINVADAASGAGGDITIMSDDQILMAVEITERSVDRSRVVATFMTKILPAGIEDYLFFIRPSGFTPDARKQAHQYFAQGHEVNFLEIKTWILASLATIGKKGRDIFNRTLVNLLDDQDIPKTLKVSWNEQIVRLTSLVIYGEDV